MTYKQIEAARERRLWLGQVIMPSIVGFIYLRSNPNTRNWMDKKFNKAKDYIDAKFKKKES